MDKTALAAQVAGCITHTGDSLFFQGIGFTGNIGKEQPSGTELGPDTGKHAGVTITAARNQPAFALRLPRIGDYFIDADGAHYRVSKDLGIARSPLLSYACVTKPL
jgi:hypothetical protein